MKTALQRHHTERLRNKRHRTHRWAVGNQRLMGIYTDTPCPCSCEFCTRNRKLHGVPVRDLRSVAYMEQGV